MRQIFSPGRSQVQLKPQAVNAQRPGHITLHHNEKYRVKAASADSAESAREITIARRGGNVTRDESYQAG